MPTIFSRLSAIPGRTPEWCQALIEWDPLWYTDHRKDPWRTNWSLHCSMCFNTVHLCGLKAYDIRLRRSVTDYACGKWVLRNRGIQGFLGNTISTLIGRIETTSIQRLFVYILFIPFVAIGLGVVLGVRLTRRSSFADTQSTPTSSASPTGFTNFTKYYFCIFICHLETECRLVLADRTVLAVERSCRRCLMSMILTCLTTMPLVYPSCGQWDAKSSVISLREAMKTGVPMPPSSSHQIWASRLMAWRGRDDAYLVCQRAQHSECSSGFC